MGALGGDAMERREGRHGGGCMGREHSPWVAAFSLGVAACLGVVWGRRERRKRNKKRRRRERGKRKKKRRKKKSKKNAEFFLKLDIFGEKNKIQLMGLV
jgi:hypothetical protein